MSYLTVKTHQTRPPLPSALPLFFFRAMSASTLPPPPDNLDTEVTGANWKRQYLALKAQLDTDACKTEGKKRKYVILFFVAHKTIRLTTTVTQLSLGLRAR